MGIIIGALGGLGDAAQKVGQDMLQAGIRQDQMQQESDIATQREQTLAQFKSQLAVSTADQQREQMVARVSTAQQPILDQGIVSRATAARAANLPAYDPSDTTGPASFHGNASDALAAINSLPDGPDKDAALAQLKSQVAANKSNVGTLTMDDLTDQEKSQFAPTDADRQNAWTQAATQTGDIDPKDAAMLGIRGASVDARLALVDARLQIGQMASDARNAKTQADYDWRMAQLADRIAKTGSGNTDFDKKIQLLKDGGASPTDIANFIMERKQPSLEDLANGFLKSDPQAGTSKAMTVDQAYAKAKALRDVSRSVNAAPAPMPGTATPPAAGASAARPPLGSFFQ